MGSSSVTAGPALKLVTMSPEQNGCGSLAWIHLYLGIAHKTNVQFFVSRTKSLEESISQWQQCQPADNLHDTIPVELQQLCCTISNGASLKLKMFNGKKQQSTSRVASRNSHGHGNTAN